MTEKKITQLTELTSASATDIIPIVDDPSGVPETKKITIANLLGGYSVIAHDHTGAGESQIPEAGLTLSDNTTNNASTSKHGLRAKLTGDATKFQNEAGNVVGVTSQIYVSAASMTPQATTGCAELATTSMSTNKQDVKTLDFDASSIEYAQSIIFAMPSDYNGGTFTYSIDWKHAATTTNFKVAWCLQAVAYADGGALDTSWGSAIQVNDTGGNTNYIYRTPTSSAVTPSGSPAANRAMVIRVYRNATDGTNDTLAIDAGLIGIQITYTRA